MTNAFIAALMFLSIPTRSSIASPTANINTTLAQNSSLTGQTSASPSTALQVQPGINNAAAVQTNLEVAYSAVPVVPLIPVEPLVSPPSAVAPTAPLVQPGLTKSPPTSPAGISLTPVYPNCTVSQSFALTFDDGPSKYSEDLDKTLASSQAKASYFLNGNNYGCIYDYGPLLLARHKAGHLLGSHSWSHPNLTMGTYREIHYQLELVEHAFIRILGVKPLWFRPPFGEYNDLVLQVLLERGYKGLVMWTGDTHDATEPVQTPEQRIEAYTGFPERSNILNHETVKGTVLEVMPSVVPKLVGRGLKLITVPDCLNIPNDPKEWYEYVGEPSTKDDTWTCVGTPGPEKFA
ncbi:hypothetical protein CROQUDRAFT_62636 [Cronartium quercuum f. sp. fusiforme G11]|uniref:NodB homology domain-containing protein n=1 Tax=Cronartium quercuum f. sp. fusiforme G11 TaxID=708437 RepID=A0A9P6TCG0_9BASI|nr:hypothetical protein CROQUDRAFT_62636 [Cronartium quercuum f. sp. fusiforme G11]